VKLWRSTQGNSDAPVTRDGTRVALVTGAPRSGTTALVELLNCHPDIAMMNERYNRLVAREEVGLDHFLSDRLRDFQDGDGSPVAFGMDVTQQALSKLGSAKVVGDKVPRPRNMFKLAQRLGNAPVIAILREPQGMAESYMGRVRRAEMQLAKGGNATWQTQRDFKAAVREFNDYVELLRDMSASKSGGTMPWLLIDYVSLFSGAFPVERIFEFLDLDPSRASGLDSVLNVRDAKRLAADEMKQFVGLHADYSGYRQVYDRMGLAGKDTK